MNRKNSSSDIPRILRMPFAQGVALLYLLAAGLWIYFSDELAEWMTETASQLRILSTYKGWFFVVVTAGLLFLVLKRFASKIRLAQQKLHESEERFRMLFETMNSCVAIYKPLADNSDFEFVNMNPIGLRYSKISRENLIGRKVTEVFPDVKASGVFGALQRVARTGTPEYLPLRHYKDERIELWVENHIFKLPSGLVVAVYEDITEKHQAETALKESQTILKAAMDNCSAGIAIADAPDGKLRYVNEAGLFIRGGTDKELVKNIGIEQYVASWKILHLDGTPYRSEEVPLARAVLHGEHCSEEFIVRRADNDDRLVWATAAPIKNEQDEITAGIVIFLDVTDKKIAEQNLHARNQELERFNKASVGRELRMIELKKEVNELCRELGKPVPYPVQNSARRPEESV